MSNFVLELLIYLYKNSELIYINKTRKHYLYVKDEMQPELEQINTNYFEFVLTHDSIARVTKKYDNNSQKIK